ncbi:bZIP transcription factor, partial [Aspergillus homomorphus CBS 101889]
DAERLARIRENQRRSRAKKQAHIRELEQKLASLQEQARQKDVEHRLAVQGLEAENRRLRSLLASVGISPSTVGEYLNTADGSDSMRKIAIPSLHRSEVKTQSCCGQQSSSSEDTPSDTGVVSKLQGVGSCSSVEGSSTRFLSCEKPPQGTSVCGCSPNEDQVSWPASGSGDVLNTTLCAIADELITQYNTRGVELAEIRHKLWAGFSKGLTTEEGCRVQNQILFQVLDEISNN